jgi:hypothetical protein
MFLFSLILGFHEKVYFIFMFCHFFSFYFECEMDLWL